MTKLFLELVLSIAWHFTRL